MNIYQALLDNYLEIYQVNLKTGNINFIKNMYHGTSDNISNYCEEILNNIYEEDLLLTVYINGFILKQ